LTVIPVDCFHVLWGLSFDACTGSGECDDDIRQCR